MKKLVTMITQSQLMELMHYDCETGIFTWRPRGIKWFSHCEAPERACNSWNARFALTVAGYITKTNARCMVKYVDIRITINKHGRIYKAHVLAYLYMVGRYPVGDVDHINQNGLDNSWKNLRDVSHSTNLKNSKIQKNNVSGFNGVCWYKPYEKWQVQVYSNGEKFHGGYFLNLDDAIEKRKKMNIEFGFYENHGTKR